MPNGDKVPTRPEWWDVYPGEAYPYGGAEKAARTELIEKYGDFFWEWAEKTYSMGDVDRLRASETFITTTAQWDFFLRNVYGLREGDPDYPGPYKPPTGLPRGRPEPEKYGITETDWRTLEMLGGSSSKVQKELETWLSTGYITEFQARDIWNEVDTRVRRAHAYIISTGFTEEEWPAEHQRRLKLQEQARLEEQVRREPRFPTPKQLRARAWRGAVAQPEYAPAFEEERLGLGGPQPWKDWFERQYPTLVSRFKAQLPKFEARAYPGLTPREAEKEIEKTWAEILRKRKPELREEYATRYPYGIEGRPWAMAPRIQTVGF